MKKCIALLLAVLLILTLAACGKERTKREQPTSRAPHSSAAPPTVSATDAPIASITDAPKERIPYLKASEVVINGIAAGTTREELLQRLGPPRNGNDADDCEYDGVVFFMGINAARPDDRNADPVFAAEVTQPIAQTPRGIQVGDAFDEVMAKFPQEKDFRGEPDGSFYGTTSDFGFPFGYVREENGERSISIHTERPILQIDFKNGVAVRIFVMYTPDD